MSLQTFKVDGVEVPRLVYGTAWKEDETRRLTELALEQGFRGIDTANQRCHYHEAAVGEALRAALERGLTSRGELFIQTKFTFQDGQDERLPYDPEDDIETQVASSFASSLDHLGVETIDSYVLHGPATAKGLIEEDWDAWRSMEALHVEGRVRFLGVSNVNLRQLCLLHEGARIKPTFVQNRCFASRDWDAQVRDFCTKNGMVYQGFSLLTANRKTIAKPEMQQIADRHGLTVNQVVFLFALAVGMQPLTGTSDADHMREDLETLELRLDPSEVRLIAQL